MKYGRYHNKIKEVIVFSKTFKAVTSDDISYFTKIINDKDKAKYYAYEVVFDEDEYTWNDLKENEMSEVWDKYYELVHDQKPQNLDILLEVFSENVRSAATEFNNFFEEIVADLNNCAINRAINGIKGLPLIEQFGHIFDFMGMSFEGYVLGEGNRPGDILRDHQALSAASRLLKRSDAI